MEHGHRVTLVASGFSTGSPVDRHAGMAIVRVGNKYTFPLLVGRVARRLLARRRFDLVVEDLNKIPVYPLRWSTPPLVVLAHHLWGRVAFGAAPFHVAAITLLSERLIPSRYRGARFIAVSPSTSRDLVRLGVAASQVEIIRNAAGPEELAESPLRTVVPTFLYLGRLQRYKRVDLLIDAARVLVHEGLSFEIWIAGTGPHEAALRRRARRLGVEDKVRFLGFVPDREKTALYGQAWANVLMSRKEGWGLTVLEAALARTPSVVSFAPGLWDSVQHLETGLWIPYHHLRTLADGLRFLINHPSEVERMGQAARERALARTWDDAASELEAVLLRAAGR